MTVSFFRIAPYLPREGPETFARIAKLLPYQRYRHLSTSGGVGNLVSIMLIWARNCYRYLSTSRGAGNSFFIKFIWIIIFCIDTYLPREGPGINDDGINSYISYFCKEIARFEVFRNSIEPQTRMFEGELALPIHLERGRKLSSVWCQTCLPFLYRYLSTSRGAGNT